MTKSLLWKKWLYPEKNNADFFEYYYKTREIEDIDFFHNWKYPDWLIDERKLPDIDIAVEIIKKAIKNNERIIVFWDYDCDWIPWTAICTDALKKLWAQVSYRIPHREDDWYWLKKYFLDEFKEKDVKLVITVDNWIASFEEAKYAKEIWIDLIITDHHEVQDWVIPDALATVNPQREEYKEFKDICWAVVAWKIMIALWKEIKWEEWSNEKIRDKYIELAALSTVADVMPLKSENRVIVRKWLEKIKRTENEWLLALFEEMWHDLGKDITSDFFWFQLWPRINASWRMSHGHFWVQLLLWNTDHAKYLENLNNQRKTIVNNALEKIENRIFENELVIVEDKEWNSWIIGLIAWKIQERSWLPVIALQEKEKELVWSCRSPEWFNMFEFLSEFRDDFLYFWWHAQACWLTIKKENYKDFKNRALKLWNEMIEENPLENHLKLDFEIDTSEIDLELAKKIKKLEPFWKWNKSPIFLVKEIKPEIFKVWRKKEHVSFSFKWKKAIWFFLWEHFDKIKKSSDIDIAFAIETQKWNWEEKLNLRIIDLIINRY